ncbi:MAG: sugar ABC transporter substrate-binding protein [Candidatus Omnitrophica bacterium]|nr:sugar ABC transporter substrate-binding protein [Candidatus Omnitrophota bacterium]MCG2705042.1 sugar ABC transporter substrate-binding protein [Candidatus Omnitrophota bacterium]
MKNFYANKKSAAFFISALFISLFITFLATGCCPRETRPTLKIAIWGGPNEIDIINKLVKEWQKDHPEVIAKVEHTPAGSYTNKLLIRIAGGTAPDVMFAEGNIFVNFFTIDAFMDLTPFIEKDDGFELSDFFPEGLERFTRNGKVYCIPRDVAPFACVYYNKRLFDEAGLAYPDNDWDWKDMLEKAQKLTKKSPAGKVSRYGFYGWTWQNFIYSNGGSIVDNVENPKKFTMTGDKAVDGLQFYADLINKYKVSPSPVTLGDLGMGAQQLFMSQKLAMYQSGYWESNVFRDIKDFEWDVAMFPKGPSGIRRFGTGGSGYCILKTTKHPELAWEIVKLLTGEKSQIALAGIGLTQPAIESIAEGPYFAESPALPKNKAMLNEAIQYVVYEPFHPKWREINELYLVPELDLVFNGTETAKDAAMKIAPEANRLLKE